MKTSSSSWSSLWWWPLSSSSSWLLAATSKGFTSPRSCVAIVYEVVSSLAGPARRKAFLPRPKIEESKHWDEHR